MLKNRYLTECIVEDLSEKMVFVGGPRQVGKTTLATSTGTVGQNVKVCPLFSSNKVRLKTPVSK
jgi:predicted AAA+ superfamily ATPase